MSVAHCKVSNKHNLGVLAQGQPEAQALTQDSARHASLPLPGAMPARSALPQFDPSSVFGSAAAQSFDAPWPGHAPEPAGALYPGGGSGEDPGGDSLAPLEGGPGVSRGGDAGAQRRTESEPVATFARGRAPVNFLGEYVARQHALGQGALAADAGGARCEKMHSSLRDQAGFEGLVRRQAPGRAWRHGALSWARTADGGGVRSNSEVRQRVKIYQQCHAICGPQRAKDGKMTHGEA